ncbi:MAG: hypothetical protein KC646_02705 [Candidatus Cloacimonetes bacterium]|nr:hypothetical protein [Candidatus Cloacimonadota bacterium]
MLEVLSNYIKSGAKPIEDHKIGAEYELISITKDLTPVSFTEKPSIMCVLKSLQSRYKLESGEVINDKLFSLKAKVGSITIEPGCQIELSATPRKTLNELQEDLNKYLTALKDIGNNCNISFLASPTNPYLHPEQIPLLPKERYQIMNRLFESTGTHGKYMMRASTSIQVCIDYTDPTDLMKKYVLSLYLSPFAKALFSSSPFIAGKKTPYLSLRSHIWNNVDPDRQGLPPQLMKKDLSLDEYCQYILDLKPMFISENGTYKALNKGGFLGSYPEFENQEDAFNKLFLHMSQTFIETRINQYLEFRSTDSQLPQFQMCVPAFYKGLFSSSSIMDQAYEIIKDFSIDDIQQLMLDIPTTAIHTPVKSVKVIDYLKDLLHLSHKGLKETSSTNEEKFLEPIMQLVLEDSYCPSDYILRAYKKDYNEDLLSMFDFFSI